MRCMTTAFPDQTHHDKAVDDDGQDNKNDA